MKAFLDIKTVSKSNEARGIDGSWKEGEGWGFQENFTGFWLIEKNDLNAFKLVFEDFWEFLKDLLQKNSLQNYFKIAF